MQIPLSILAKAVIQELFSTGNDDQKAKILIIAQYIDNLEAAGNRLAAASQLGTFTNFNKEQGRWLMREIDVFAPSANG